MICSDSSWCFYWTLLWLFQAEEEIKTTHCFMAWKSWLTNKAKDAEGAELWGISESEKEVCVGRGKRGEGDGGVRAVTDVQLKERRGGVGGTYVKIFKMHAEPVCTENTAKSRGEQQVERRAPLPTELTERIAAAPRLQRELTAFWTQQQKTIVLKEKTEEWPKWRWPLWLWGWPCSC